ncbi:MAG: pentapeptide repeat-containing protein [Anaerolineae bacterium]|nr:pentapeptide repeat-containing protein [Anaerolineae bacterium]
MNFIINEDGTVELYTPEKMAERHNEKMSSSKLTLDELDSRRSKRSKKSKKVSATGSTPNSTSAAVQLPAQEVRSDLVPCPYCPSFVRFDRLERHIHRVHESGQPAIPKPIKPKIRLPKLNLQAGIRKNQPIRKRNPLPDNQQLRQQQPELFDGRLKRKWIEEKINTARAEQRTLDLGGIDLRGVPLDGMDLHGIYLNKANLSFANLNHANMRGAFMVKANLHGANLSGADLTEASLQGADLSNAILDGAKLTGANLTGANLQGVDLTKAERKIPSSSQSGRIKFKKGKRPAYADNRDMTKEKVYQSFYETRDGSKGLGHMRRDIDGTFGSYPLHDPYGDEAESD